MLPTFLGRSLEQILSTLPPNSRVLDFGSGDAALALQEMANKFPHLVCHGVTYPVRRTHLPSHQGISVFRSDGDSFLLQHPETYDLIIAVQSIRYSPDQFATLKKAYRALKPNGIFLTDMIYNEGIPLVNRIGEKIDPELLEKTLRDSGYSVEIKNIWGRNFISYSLALQKNVTKPKLTLPISLVKIPELRPGYRTSGTPFDELGYNLAKVSYVYQLNE